MTVRGPSPSTNAGMLRPRILVPMLVTDKKEYVLHLRLYEVEERLKNKGFVRISNTEIINIKKAKKFDLSSVGTICVSLTNGNISFVSRRYVTKIKKTLGI